MRATERSEALGESYKEAIHIRKTLEDLYYQNFFFFMIHKQISTTNTLPTITAG